MILTIVLLLAILSLLVFVHEFGHFLVARRNGIEVEEFGFGFPPRLIGIKRGRTLYSINLLPLGGFVRLKGEDAAAGPNSFEAAKTLVKAKVLLAGVAMNLLLAYVVLVTLSLTGLPPLIGTPPAIGHPAYAQAKELLVLGVDPGSPAEKSGLKTGDYVLSGDSQNFLSEDQLVEFTKAHAGQSVDFRVVEGRVIKELKIKLRAPDATNGFLGVTPLQVYKLRYNFPSALLASFLMLGQLVWLIVKGIILLIGSLPVLVAGIFTKAVPSAAQNSAGPVGIYFILKSVMVLGASYVALLIVNISAALAVFNTLPVPALDGGKLAVILAQRLAGRKFSQRTEVALSLASWAFLLLLVTIITIYDFRKFL